MKNGRGPDYGEMNNLLIYEVIVSWVLILTIKWWGPRVYLNARVFHFIISEVMGMCEDKHMGWMFIFGCLVYLDTMFFNGRSEMFNEAISEAAKVAKGEFST